MTVVTTHLAIETKNRGIRIFTALQSIMDKSGGYHAEGNPVAAKAQSEIGIRPLWNAANVGQTIFGDRKCAGPTQIKLQWNVGHFFTECRRKLLGFFCNDVRCDMRMVIRVVPAAYQNTVAVYHPEIQVRNRRFPDQAFFMPEIFLIQRFGNQRIS